MKSCQKKINNQRGFTLVELLIAVAIVGILAALAIPSFVGYVKESRLSEAATNIQGILESEQAYFLRFQRYTAQLPICPADPPADKDTSQLWPEGGCSQGWNMLGWKPDSGVYFQYQVLSLYNEDGDRANLPSDLGDGWGVDWSVEFSSDLNTVLPWCAVQATADTDQDGEFVFFRTNSFNQKVFRQPDDVY
jgi:prepilin-type N-terminal cleavage/methylation domain-containing protein